MSRVEVRGTKQGNWKKRHDPRQQWHQLDLDHNLYCTAESFSLKQIASRGLQRQKPATTEPFFISKMCLQ